MRLISASPTHPSPPSFNPRTRTGCDWPCHGYRVPRLRFNPRTRTGCDREYAEANIDHTVSTHAPARGATEGYDLEDPYNYVSTHAPARGATNQLCHNVAHIVFQPTHPHGVRQLRRTLPKLSWRFNPRTRTGCDVLKMFFYPRTTSFNPRTRTGCDGTLDQ